MAQFTKARMEEIGDEWRLEAKDEGFSSVIVGNQWSQPSPSLSSSDKSAFQKHPREHGKASAPEVRDHSNKSKPKDGYSLVASDCDTRTISSSHHSPIPNLSGNARMREHPQPLVQETEQVLPVLETVKRYNSRTIGYSTSHLNITVSTKFSRIVKKI